jgi:Ca2+-binding EF-hand superfamily protein
MLQFTTLVALLVLGLGLALLPLGGDAAAGERAERMLERFDTDGDGQLSEDERAEARASMRERMLDRFDANGNGELDDDERAVARQEMRRRRGER